MIRVPVPLALVVVAVLGAACSEDEGTGPLPTPSSACPSDPAGPTGPSATGLDGVTGGAGGQTGGLPTTSPALATGTLTEGELRYELTGSVQLHKTLPVLVTAVYTPPPGGFAIVWTAGGSDASTVGLADELQGWATAPTFPSITRSPPTALTFLRWTANATSRSGRGVRELVGSSLR
jgi:hypothetical protein